MPRPLGISDKNVARKLIANTQGGFLMRRIVVSCFVVMLFVCSIAISGCGTSKEPPASTSSPFSANLESSGIEDEIRTIVAELLAVDRSKLSGATSLADLGADELDFVELVMELEDHFHISIPDDKATKLFGSEDWSKGMENVTLVRLAALVRERQGSP